jgi:hypothetical protein
MPFDFDFGKAAEILKNNQQHGGQDEQFLPKIGIENLTGYNPKGTDTNLSEVSLEEVTEMYSSRDINSMEYCNYVIQKCTVTVMTDEDEIHLLKGEVNGEGVYFGIFFNSLWQSYGHDVYDSPLTNSREISEGLFWFEDDYLSDLVKVESTIKSLN